MFTINLSGSAYELVDIRYKYLYPYILRFTIKNHLDIDDNSVLIPNEHVIEFIATVNQALKELLSDCYIEPTHKQRSKYSTRFQKITFEDKDYVLNYRTDIVGIIGYGLFYLIDWLRQESQ